MALEFSGVGAENIIGWHALVADIVRSCSGASAATRQHKNEYLVLLD